MKSIYEFLSLKLDWKKDVDIKTNSLLEERFIVYITFERIVVEIQ